MVWLTGCKGMLGAEVARQLEENNIPFTGTDYDVDITDIKKLEDFATNLVCSCKEGISFIINCAAYTAVDKAESDRDSAFKLNMAGPENIARVAKKTGAVLVHISSDYVFDGSADYPLSEDEKINPVNVYGESKAAGDRAVQDILEKYYIIRTAWLYGLGGKNFVCTMLKLMNSRNCINVVNDQRGSPTFAGDLAGVIINIIKSGNKINGIPYGVYNFTDSGNITWFDFACEILRQGNDMGLVFNKKCVVKPCSTSEYPSAAKRPSYSVLCKDKIKKTLLPEIPYWKESLHKFLSNVDLNSLK